MITEGLIKLPQGLLSEMARFVMTWYYAYVQASIDRKFRFDDESLDRAHRIVNAEMQAHGITTTPSQVRKARTQPSFMKTFALNDELYGERLSMPVRLRLVFERHGGIGQHVGLYRDRTAFIILSVYNMHMSNRSMTSIPALKNCLSKVPELLGYLEHELTHLVQYRALETKHGDQVVGDYSDEDGFNDEYGLAPVEFDPLIKSELQRFKRIDAKYKSYPGYNKQEVLNAFVRAGPAPKWMTDSSALFDTLKRRAPVRWKKAVKLFTSAH